MKAKDVAKNWMRKWGMPAVLLAASALWLGAAGRPFGTNPFSGDFGGDGFNIHVVDSDIDETFEIVDTDSGASYTYTPISTDTTVMIRYNGSNGDTAIIHVTGIRPKRGNASGANYSAQKDSLAWYHKMYKLDGGDSTATDSVLHMFEQVWVDSGEGNSVIVWAKGNSATSTPLRKIPPRRITAPIAHVLFGTQDTPLLEKVVYGVYDTSRTALFDSVMWSQSASGVQNKRAMVDTLVGDSDVDTSRVVLIDGLEALSVFITSTVVDGSIAGGEYSLTMTPQVSIDSTNWTSIGPTFTQTASATASQSQILFYTTDSGTAVPSRVATKAQRTLIDASLYLRWIVTRTVDTYKAGVSDSTFLNIRMARQYPPSDKGVVFELRQYPNIENALQYTADYVVRDRAHVLAGQEVVRDFNPAGQAGGGMQLPPRCYLAIVAKGDDADRVGYVALVGKRRSRR